MLKYCLMICCSFLVLLSVSQPLQGQACCAAPPTTQSTGQGVTDTTYSTVSDFTVTLSGGNGNFEYWLVGESTGAQGSDSCWNPNVNPAYVPEYPGVTGTAGNANANNQVVDKVGWLPASVNYIRSNSLEPCGEQVNQSLWIECPGSTTPVYFASTTLTASVYVASVTNCRQGSCQGINH